MLEPVSAQGLGRSLRRQVERGSLNLAALFDERGPKKERSLSFPPSHSFAVSLRAVTQGAQRLRMGRRLNARGVTLAATT